MFPTISILLFSILVVLLLIHNNVSKIRDLLETRTDVKSDSKKKTGE